MSVSVLCCTLPFVCAEFWFVFHLPPPPICIQIQDEGLPSCSMLNGGENVFFFSSRYKSWFWYVWINAYTVYNVSQKCIIYILMCAWQEVRLWDLGWDSNSTILLVPPWLGALVSWLGLPDAGVQPSQRLHLLLAGTYDQLFGAPSHRSSKSQL